MSKSDKLRARLRTVPADFTWEELVLVLRGAGFKDVSDKPGSYRTFLAESGEKIFLHKPHPLNTVKRYVLREVLAKLDELKR